MILNRKFGSYVLLKRLAVGGMAEIFLAARVGPARFEKFAVIKTILSQYNVNPDYVRLFYREAELGGLFNHPNVVHTYDCGRIEGTHFLAMEHMDGVTVAEMAERGAELGLPLPQEFAIQICIDALEGLHYTHTLQGVDGTPLQVVHRDISPQNIFVTYGGFGKVFDFGIARLAGDDENDPYKGMLAGKYAYMSPEQCRGETLDARSDVFSIGIILYELTTGYRLFKREEQVQTLRAITEDAITPPSELLERYPRYLERIVMKALARDVDERFGDALEFADDLRRFLKISGSRPTSHLLGAYVGKLFESEISQFSLFREEAVGRVVAEHGRLDPVGEAAAAAALRPNLEPEEVHLAEDVVLTPDEGPTQAAPIHEPARPTGPQRLATVAIAETSESGLFDAADIKRLQRARRFNRVLIAVALLAVAAAIGVTIFLMIRFSDEGSHSKLGTEEDAQTQSNVGIVKVSSVPMGARVFLNGQELEKPAPVEVEVPQGQPVTIEVKAEGYKTFTKELTLKDGQQRFVVDAKLKEGSDEKVEERITTAVRISSTPEEARVIFDGKPLEDGTPVILPDVDVGTEHVLILAAPDHESLIYPFTLEDEAELDLALELNPVLDAELGTVIFDSWPRGARVVIDERYAGRTPLPPLQLAPGIYPVLVELKPYESHAEELVIEAGSTVSRNPRLGGGGDAVENEIQEEAALVDIRSNPETEVFIDSRSVGRTPLEGIAVNPGTVWIEFRDQTLGIRHVEVVSFQENDLRSMDVTIPLGKLVVDANAKAEVFIDGTSLGTVPVRADVYVGDHEVRLVIDGETRTVTATVSRNKTFTINETF